jgi:phosphoglycerate dehydrogenase-like enzyme
VTTIWLPYADVGEHLGRIPDSVTIDVYDGSADPPGSIGDVELYVTPYDFRVEPIELAREMPRLKVMQTLTAGVDNYLPLVPPGVTLCNARGVHDASTADLPQ